MSVTTHLLLAGACDMIRRFLQSQYLQHRLSCKSQEEQGYGFSLFSQPPLRKHISELSACRLWENRFVLWRVVLRVMLTPINSRKTFGRVTQEYAIPHVSFQDADISCVIPRCWYLMGHVAQQQCAQGEESRSNTCERCKCNDACVTLRAFAGKQFPKQTRCVLCFCDG